MESSRVRLGRLLSSPCFVPPRRQWWSQKIIGEASFNTKMNEKAYGPYRTVFIYYDCTNYREKARIIEIMTKKWMKKKCYLNFAE
jgi:hypothetical protein